MNREILADIFCHQLKGIMLHVDMYCVSVLHGYRRLKMLHEKAVKEETESFMRTRYKSIEYLGEILDIPAPARIDVPQDATEHELNVMWLKWEMDAAEMYGKAIEEDPDCRIWKDLHQAAANEIRCISLLEKK